MRQIIFYTCFFAHTMLLAQNPDSPPVLNYEGANLFKYLVKSTRIKFPSEFREDCTKRLVLASITFTVTKTGQVTDIAINGDLPAGTKKDIEKHIRSTSGHWQVQEPAKDFSIMVPILFRQEYRRYTCDQKPDDAQFETTLRNMLSWQEGQQNRAVEPLLVIVTYPPAH